jgi:hypothetical protein
MFSLLWQNYEPSRTPTLVEKLPDDAQFSTQRDLCYIPFEVSW